MLTVSKGHIEQDYFLLKRKPHYGSLFIHPDSAAVTVTPDGDYKMLGSGFHHLKPTEEILAVFNLEMQRFTYGPEKDENPFANRKSGENYTGFHARQLRAQKVRSITKDNQEIYPSFLVRYCLKDTGKTGEKAILEIAKNLHQTNQSGEAADRINELLGHQVAAYWSGQIKNASLDELLSGNSRNNFHQILSNLNEVLNKPPIPTVPSRASAAGIRRLSEIQNFSLPFIRVYLLNIWTQSGRLNESEKANSTFRRLA